MQALGFVMNRASPYYAGRLPLPRWPGLWRGLAGIGGRGAEYVLNTVTQLEARGIRDSGPLAVAGAGGR